MIPRTFPSIIEAFQTKMVVYVLPSITGLTAWIDYIPVKGVVTESATLANTYANGGYQVVKSLDSLTGLQAWIGYIPVYEDASYNKPWSTDAGGYVPVGGLFSPLSLFSGGAPGAWYDPSDYTTLFQDSAGTTPVTAVEQPVGLMLDKSKGLVLGSELVTNGDFSSGTTGWTARAGCTLSAVDGWLRLTYTGSGAARANFTTLTTVAGRTYKVLFAVRNTTSTTTAGFFAYADAFATQIGTSGSKTADGSYEMVFTATSTITNIEVGNSASNGGVGAYLEFDNISVRELPGNHAFQSTSASRPVLSARYNLLTKTEQFDDAVWIKDNVTVTANAVVAPDGTTTADKIVEAATSSFHRVYVNGVSVIGGVNYTLSAYARAGERDFLALFFTTGGASGAYFDLANGTIGTVAAGFVASITSAGNGWYRCSISTTPSTSATFYPLIGPAPANGTANYAGDITKGIFLWGGQLIVTNSLTSNAYQRVNTATDYNTTGFLPYLRFDGVDDSLSTNSISFTSTDKMSVFAGVRKLSDAAQAILYELSTDTFANNGAFLLWAPGAVAGSNYYARVRGSLVSNAVTGASYPAPITNVATMLADIAGDSVNVRLNAASAVTSTSDLGTGNFGNYPLFIGRRNNATLPFNGQMYSMIIVGKAVTAGELSSTETYVNQKTGAY